MRTTLAGGAGPRIVDHIGRLGGIALGGIAADRVGGQEPVEALGVGGRRSGSVVIHVPAADPFRPGRHANLVRAAVIADHGAHGVRAVPVHITRHGRIARQVSSVVVDGVMPVVIVIGRQPIPAAVLVFQRRVIPVVAGILPGDDHALAGDSPPPKPGAH